MVPIHLTIRAIILARKWGGHVPPIPPGLTPLPNSQCQRSVLKIDHGSKCNIGRA